MCNMRTATNANFNTYTSACFKQRNKMLFIGVNLKLLILKYTYLVSYWRFKAPHLFSRGIKGDTHPPIFQTHTLPPPPYPP